MSRVDVLAVLDGLIADMGIIPGTTGHQVAHARDACAELLEAATATSAIVRLSGMHCLRLDAAIARAGGAA